MNNPDKKLDNVFQHYTLRQLHSLKDQTDYARLDKMSDNEIDYSDIPETQQNDWAKARIVLPKKKKAISIRMDEDILNWFKAQEVPYQPLINEVLKAYMKAHR